MERKRVRFQEGVNSLIKDVNRLSFDADLKLLSRSNFLRQIATEKKRNSVK